LTKNDFIQTHLSQSFVALLQNLTVAYQNDRLGFVFGRFVFVFGRVNQPAVAVRKLKLPQAYCVRETRLRVLPQQQAHLCACDFGAENNIKPISNNDILVYVDQDHHLDLLAKLLIQQHYYPKFFLVALSYA
jgi:hypothetical protein